MRRHSLVLALVCAFAVSAAAETRSPSVSRPVYLTLLPTPLDFKLFASGGGNGNWYVGHNTCWVVRLATAPAGPYAHAFLGARLGRAKTETVPGSPPWVRRPIEGEIDIAAAQEAVWPESRRFKLADTTDIPTEGDSENTSEDVGEARWYWVEIPLSLIDTNRHTYVALFSPSDSLTDAQSAPILAGGRATQAIPSAWLSSGVHGQPPLTAEEALQTPIPNFAPAIALKLVPPNDHVVAARAFWEDPNDSGDMSVGASVIGQDIEEARLEVSTDNGASWTPSGRPLWGPPYFFAYTPSGERRLQLRVTATDIWGNRGSSVPLAVKDGQKYLPAY